MLPSYDYTADQHEIQNEDQYEQIDDKAADPSHYGLPDAGKGGYDKRGRITAQYVIACFTFDDSGYFFDRSNDGLRIEIEVLQFVDQHPYYQWNRYQEEEDGFSRDQQSGSAPFHFSFCGKAYHLFSDKDIDGQCSQQSA